MFRTTLLSVFLASLVAASTVHGQIKDLPISASDAGSYVGQPGKVCGHVVAASCSIDRKTIILELEHVGPGSSLGVGLASSFRAMVDPRLEDRYIGREVCAVGRVEALDDSFVIRVESAAKVTMTDEAALASTSVFAPYAIRACDPDVTRPTVKRMVRPGYTDEARYARITGLVLLEGAVQTDGTMGDVRVLQSLDRKHGLDDKSIAAVRKWRFTPGVLRGQVVPVIVTIELTFDLR